MGCLAELRTTGLFNRSVLSIFVTNNLTQLNGIPNTNARALGWILSMEDLTVDNMEHPLPLVNEDMYHPCLSWTL